MSLLLASEKFVLEFYSPRHLSLSGSYPLDLSSLGDPAGSCAIASLAQLLQVTGTYKPLRHGMVELPFKVVFGIEV
jgi:hypothetical protein